MKSLILLCITLFAFTSCTSSVRSDVTHAKVETINEKRVNL